MNPVRNVVNLGRSCIIGWRKDDMVALDTIDRPGRRIDGDTVRLSQAELRHAEGHTGGWWERLLRELVRNKLNAPEETATTDVADVGMLRQKFVDLFRKQDTHINHILQEVVFADNSLHFERRRAGYRVTLVGVPMYEGA